MCVCGERERELLCGALTGVFVVGNDADRPCRPADHTGSCSGQASAHHARSTPLCLASCCVSELRQRLVGRRRWSSPPRRRSRWSRRPTTTRQHWRSSASLPGVASPRLSYSNILFIVLLLPFKCSDYPEFAEVPEGEASDYEEDLKEEEEEEEEEDDDVEEEEEEEAEEEEVQEEQAEAQGTTSRAAKDDGLGPRRSIRKRSSPARLKPTVTNMGAESETIREIARAAGAKDGQVLAKALDAALADGRTETTSADMEKARKEVALEARMAA